MKILIAEDDSVSRRLLETVLTKCGYDVEQACDGDEAWQRLKEADAPKLAVLDWMMPGMDGIEVCRRLRELKSGDPVHLILLTSRDSKDDIIEGLRAGANDYISKPFDNEELRARVDAGRRVIELQEALAARVKELQDALDHVKTLQGILPICMHCHRIRNDQESWEKLEQYIGDHSDAEFSHGLCPECLEKYYPEEPDEDE